MKFRIMTTIKNSNILDASIAKIQISIYGNYLKIRQLVTVYNTFN